MSGSERYWGRYAGLYDRFTDYVVGSGLRQAVFTRLTDERNLGEVVEFGCGTGFFTRAVAGNAASVLATDISEAMLAKARANLGAFGNIVFRKTDCESFSNRGDCFDTVLMANIIHVLASPTEALAEARRVLRKNGRLLVVTYTDHGLDFLQVADVALRFLTSFGMPPPYGLKNYAPSELEAVVAGSGFRTEALEVIGGNVRALFLQARKI